MYYLANFEQNERNESFKDVGRAGILTGSIGTGALLGSETGSAIRLKNINEDLKLGIGDPESLKYEKSKIINGRLFDHQQLKDSFKNKKIGGIAKSFQPSRVFSSNKSKLIGASVGAVGGYVLGNAAGESFLPNRRYEDDLLAERAKERRREASSLNRSSQEIRGWANLGKQLGNRLGG